MTIQLHNKTQNLIYNSKNVDSQLQQSNHKSFPGSGLLRLLGVGLFIGILGFSGVAQAIDRGSSGAAVRRIQNRLANQSYYNGPVTGYYGSLTERAVRRFQSAQNLKVDGIAGPSTISELQEDNNVRVYPGVLERGDRGQDVIDLQAQLTTGDYYDGPVTGYYGKATEQAVRRLQASQDLKVDGIVGPRTWSVVVSRSVNPDPLIN
ncbi:peptidoglycan-binding domain-containing protein [Calothrix sp. CCY 0018]|uniref:peptidoglycan-binding domain-containing protein n=1 Tax=Calothrix sp. CCY 0018 TaxID=3103864 RepID=UPI0039C70469